MRQLLVANARSMSAREEAAAAAASAVAAAKEQVNAVKAEAAAAAAAAAEKIEVLRAAKMNAEARADGGISEGCCCCCRRRRRRRRRRCCCCSHTLQQPSKTSAAKCQISNPKSSSCKTRLSHAMLIMPTRSARRRSWRH